VPVTVAVSVFVPPKVIAEEFGVVVNPGVIALTVKHSSADVSDEGE
jgi:hypothetical protein